MRSLSTDQISGRFIRYLVTGGSAAVMDLALFMALIWSDISVPVAALISFLVAISYNFVISARMAFGSDRSFWRYLVFVSGACVGLIINVGITTLAAQFAMIPLFIAKIFGIGFAFVFNFLFNHFVTFSR